MSEQSERARRLAAAAEAIVDRAPVLDEEARHFLATVLCPAPEPVAAQRRRAA